MKKVACGRQRFTSWVTARLLANEVLCLLRLDAKCVTANCNLLVGLHHDPLFARRFTAGDQRRISSFWSQPVTSLIVEDQRRMNTTDLRVAFEGQINLD